MGDTIDMMLDGTLCQCCGVFLRPEPKSNFDKSPENFEPCGYPINLNKEGSEFKTGSNT